MRSRAEIPQGRTSTVHTLRRHRPVRLLQRSRVRLLQRQGPRRQRRVMRLPLPGSHLRLTVVAAVAVAVENIGDSIPSLNSGTVA